jgi:hypothetical protein
MAGMKLDPTPLKSLELLLNSILDNKAAKSVTASSAFLHTLLTADLHGVNVPDDLEIEPGHMDWKINHIPVHFTTNLPACVFIINTAPDFYDRVGASQ